MARITVEDCLEHVDNRFELVLLSSKRARQLAAGATPLVDPENDKPTVLALREIAAGLINKDILNQPDEPEVVAVKVAEDEIGKEINQMLTDNQVLEEHEIEHVESGLGMIEGDEEL